MACCHSLKVVDSGLVGDPMDIKMFEFTGWNIEEGGGGGASPGAGSGWGGSGARDPMTQFVVRPPGDDVDFASLVGTPAGPAAAASHVSTQLGVVHSFDFVSRLRRMSVVARRLYFSRAPAPDTGGGGGVGSSADSDGATLADANGGVAGAWADLGPGMGDVRFAQAKEFE
ncbi:hypothetical protein HK405_012204, partial [Cladochytrium tenue]